MITTQLQLQHKQNIEKQWCLRYDKALETNNLVLISALGKERDDLRLFKRD